MPGVGTLRVAPGLLGLVASILPSSFRIVGSRNARGSIGLLLESEAIADDGVELECFVADDGQQRVVTIRPVWPPAPPLPGRQIA